MRLLEDRYALLPLFRSRAHAVCRQCSTRLQWRCNASAAFSLAHCGHAGIWFLRPGWERHCTHLVFIDLFSFVPFLALQHGGAHAVGREWREGDSAIIDVDQDGNVGVLNGSTGTASSTAIEAPAGIA